MYYSLIKASIILGKKHSNVTDGFILRTLVVPVFPVASDYHKLYDRPTTCVMCIPSC